MTASVLREVKAGGSRNNGRSEQLWGKRGKFGSEYQTPCRAGYRSSLAANSVPSSHLASVKEGVDVLDYQEGVELVMRFALAGAGALSFKGPH